MWQERGTRRSDRSKVRRPVRLNLPLWHGLPIVLALASMSSCAGKTHHRLYPGPRRAAEQIAVFHSGGVDKIRVFTVDGVYGPNGRAFGYSSKWAGKFTIELEPGQHTVTLGYYSGSHRSYYNVACVFKAGAGQRYLPRPRYKGKDGWEASLIEESSGRTIPCKTTTEASPWQK